MMQKMRKPLSILLSFVMILSMLTIIPVTAEAVTVDADVDIAAPISEDGNIAVAVQADPAAKTIAIEKDITAKADKPAEADDPVPAKKATKNVELAETGATQYPLVIGKTQVTSDNKDDILNDGGKAKYNPSTRTLTLNNPTITAAYGSDWGVIQLNDEGHFYINGTFHMTKALSEYGVQCPGSVTFNGNFTFYGTDFGVGVNDTLTVASGSLKGVATNPESAIDSEHAGVGLYTTGENNSKMIINEGVTKVEAIGNEKALQTDDLQAEHFRATTPVGAYYIKGTICSFVLEDLSGVAKNLVIEPYYGTDYDVWVGARQVTSVNKNDIFGDGKVSYDPDTKTLTLDDPTINNYRKKSGQTLTFQIYSDDSLIIKGSYHMSEEAAADLPTRGVQANGDLTLDGSFTFFAQDVAVVAANDVTIASGSLTAVSTGFTDDENGISYNGQTAIGSADGGLIIKTGVTKVDATGTIYPLFAPTITLEDHEEITTPQNGLIAYEPVEHWELIAGTDGKAATHVVIEYSTIEKYGIWLALTRITSENKDDILGDGKASYDPETDTLTLDDPTINGVAQSPTSGHTYKILSNNALNIEGSYAMTDAEPDIGVFADEGLTLAGRFTFKGTDTAVSCNSSITVKSGVLTADSDDQAVFADGDYVVSGGSVTAISRGSVGMQVNGTFIAENGVDKVDVRATYPILSRGIPSLGDMVKITTPDNFVFGHDSTLDYYFILQSPSDFVDHVVIEFDPSIPVTNYDIYVGNTRVTSKNKGDVLCDGGKVKYDPDTNTLTLNDPRINDTYEYDDYTHAIFSSGSITISGSYTMTKAAAAIAVYSGGSLTLSGDFTFKATDFGVYAESDITVSSGTLTATTGEDRGTGVFADGTFSVSDNVTKVDMEGGTNCVKAEEIELGDELIITTPVNGKIIDLTRVYQSIGYAGGSKTDHAVIEHKAAPPTEAPTDPPTEAPTNPPTNPPTEAPTTPPTEAPTNSPTEAPTDPPTEAPTDPPTEEPTGEPVTEYNVWVGSTRVTSANQNDVLGDGKAEYNSTYSILRIHDPVISSNYTDTAGNTYKIYADGVDLSVQGSYRMTEDGSLPDYGIYVNNGELILAGDFTFIGSTTGVFAKSLYLSNGSIKAKGISSYGMAASQDLSINKRVTCVEAQGQSIAIKAGESCSLGDKISIITPKNGTFKKDADGWRVYDADNQLADHVLIANKEDYTGLKGKGTQDAPYLIETEADWNQLAAFIADGGYTSSVYFRLENDISVSTSVGSPSAPFQGRFLGNNKKLTVNLVGDKNTVCTAPFGQIDGATISDLTVDGTIKGGQHCSGLVGGANNATIQNVTVAAGITCLTTHCAGFIGHGGSSTNTIENSVFAGTISYSPDSTGTKNAAIFWGWSDNQAYPFIRNCLDLSDSEYPIGRGSVIYPSITNVYYTNPAKTNTGDRLWNNVSLGKPAHTISGKNVELTLEGTVGLAYGGKIYAAENENIKMTVPSAAKEYEASAGELTQEGTTLTLTMAAQDVIISLKLTAYQDYSDAESIWDNIEDRGAEKLVDGDINTKWCLNNPQLPFFMTFRTKDPVVVNGYQLVTADDADQNPGRNPVAWSLSGSKDGREWTPLTNVKHDTTLEAKSLETYSFDLTSPSDEAYSYFRFDVRSMADSSSFQLSELRLLVSEIEKPIEYNVWVGATRVTSQNKDDILNDGGKAKFDPATNTLTLDEPDIKDNYDNETDSEYYKIRSEEVDLTVKGSYHMTHNGGTTHAIRADKASLTLAGDFTLIGDRSAVAATKDVTVVSGKLTASSAMSTALSSGKKIILGDNVEYIELTSPASVCGGDEGVELSDNLYVAEPADNANWTDASHVVLKRRLLGDVDGDNVVTIFDATAVQKKLVSQPNTVVCEAAADVDGDNVITIFDATAIQKSLVSMPCPEGIGKPLPIK